MTQNHLPESANALSETAHRILHDTFGYTEFRKPQFEIIESLAGGRNALVLMPTGGGKSLCYQIPALLRPGTAVVASPLIALMGVFGVRVKTLRQTKLV